MRILIIDDEEIRWKGFQQTIQGHTLHWAKNVKEAITFNTFLTPDVVFLDHDLAEDHYISPESWKEGTGFDFVQYVIDNKAKFDSTVFIVHSLNPIGSARMVQELKDHGLIVHQVPFAWTKKGLIA